MLHDLRAAFRSLLRSPSYAFGMLLLLGLGLGLNLGLGQVMVRHLLHPFDAPEPERLVAPQIRHSLKLRGGSSSAHLFLTFQREAKALSRLGAATSRGVTVEVGERVFAANGARTSASLLPLLGLPAFLAPEDDLAGGPAKVVLRHDFWMEQLGGDPALLGRSLRIDGVDHQVAGILPKGLRLPDGILGGTQLFLPLALTPAEIETKGSSFLNLLGRLAPGASRKAAQAELSGLLDREERARMGAQYDAFLDLPLHLDVQNPARRAQMAQVLACGLFVLLIATANAANLALARWLTKARELGLRIAFGAGRATALRPMLMENLLLASASALLALLCQKPLLGLLARVIGSSPGAKTGPVLMLLPALLLAMLLLLSAPLAWALRRLDPVKALKDSARGTGARTHGRLRAGLVVAQVATATTLVATAFLLVRSLHSLSAVPLGFEPKGALVANVQLSKTAHGTPEARAAFQDALVARLQALPGVARAGLLDALPMEGSTWTSSFEADGADVMDGNHQTIALVHRVGGDAFGALDLPLVAGRAPLPGEADTCVVSQALAALAWPERDPIGHAVTLNKGPLRVVGVAQEMRFTGLRDSLMPQVYQPLRADVPTEFRVVLRGEGGDPRRFAASLRELVKALDGSVSLTRIRPLESLVEGQLQDARNMGLLFGALALLALVLAALGLAGALSLGVSQRRPELGLRMALGARMSQVVGLVLGQGLGQIALGLALGFPAAWSLGILLRGQLHGVLPGDLRATSAAAFVLALTGLGAALIPALRAARVQPAETLRSE